MKREVRERVRQDMLALLEQWRTSGETRVVFATKHGISLPKFDYWQRQLHPERMARRARRPPTGFAAVEVMAPPGSVGAIEVIFARGDRLVIRSDADAAVVRAVLTTLCSKC
jgi:hypothetical protein